MRITERFVACRLDRSLKYCNAEGESQVYKYRQLRNEAQEINITT